MQSSDFRSEETAIGRLIRVRHSAATTQQACSGEAGPWPSQEAKSAGPGQTRGGGRLGADVAAAQLRCGTAGAALKSQLKTARKGNEGQVLASSSIHNSAHQQRS